jgi:hypothetical protein
MLGCHRPFLSPWRHVGENAIRAYARWCGKTRCHSFFALVRRSLEVRVYVPVAFQNIHELQPVIDVTEEIT